MIRGLDLLTPEAGVDRIWTDDGADHVGTAHEAYGDPRIYEWLGESSTALDREHMTALTPVSMTCASRETLADAPRYRMSTHAPVLADNVAAGTSLPTEVPGADAPSAKRSITVDGEPGEVFALWRDERTLPLIMAHFADMTVVNEKLTRWRVRSYEWESETTEVRVGDYLSWQSLQGAAIPNEGSVAFKVAPAGRGTEVTMHWRFDPPGGVIGAALAKWSDVAPRELIYKTLKRFKSLVETGEIPTIEQQPAARSDAR